MNNIARVGVMIAVVAAVAAVIVVKNRAGTQDENAARATNAEGPSLPRLVDLGAHHCVPCKLMAPILSELTKDFAGQLEVVFIDVFEDTDAREKYDIGLIPTQIFYDAKGNELFRHEGFMSREDILAQWKTLGVELSISDDDAQSAQDPR